MGFKLPRLTTDIDCGPIGYPGLTVTFWLNPTAEQYEAPEDGEPWEAVHWWAQARIIERITVPGEYTEDGAGLVLEIGDGQALYDLMETPGFDWQILVWAREQYGRVRQERLQAEIKN
jgi:hypothetical protein